MNNIWLITVSLIIAIIVLIKIIPKKERKNEVIKILLNGIIITLFTLLIWQSFLSPALEKKPEINVLCDTGLYSDATWHLTLIKIINSGAGSPKKFKVVLEHPTKEATPIELKNPLDKKFCQIETFPSEIINVRGMQNLTEGNLSVGYRTIIICDNMPQDWTLWLSIDNWVEWFNVKIWVDENVVYENNLICNAVC